MVSCADSGTDDALSYPAHTMADTTQQPGEVGLVRVERAASGQPTVTLSSRDDNDNITPSFLRRLYHTFTHAFAATDRIALWVAGYLSDYLNLADLVTFTTTPTSPSYGSMTVDQGNPTLEANIDTQYPEVKVYLILHMRARTTDTSPTSTTFSASRASFRPRTAITRGLPKDYAR